MTRMDLTGYVPNRLAMFFPGAMSSTLVGVPTPVSGMRSFDLHESEYSRILQVAFPAEIWARGHNTHKRRVTKRTRTAGICVGFGT